MNNNDLYPLASTQQAVWLDQLLTPQLPCYNIAGILQFDGHMRLGLWERAIAEVVRRHDALRLVLVDQEPMPGQKVLDELTFKLEVHDYSEHADGERLARDRIHAELSAPFAIHGRVLWKMQWMQASPTRGLCLLCFHHLAIDGMSVSLIAHAIVDVYNQLARGEPLQSAAAPSYLDFVAADATYERSARHAKDQAFWLKRFSRSPDALFPAGARLGGRRPSQQVVWEIERHEFTRMAALGERVGGSVTHVLIGALAIHFSRISGNRPEIVIGMPVHNRKNTAEKRTVGMFSSMLPLTVAVDAHASFEDTLRALAAQSRACLRHQRFPLYEITRQSQKHSPQQRLFELTVSVEQFPCDFQIEGGHIFVVAQHSGFEDVPLALYLRDYDSAKSVRVEFHFDPQVLSREEVEAAVSRIERLLRAAIDAPHTQVGQLPLLGERERWNVLHGFNATEAAFPADRCIHELFEEQVARTPEATALIFEDTSLSYAELNAQANRLAHHLVALGVRPDTRVAIALLRGPDMVVALLATLKAGGAYVPLDPDYPAERLAFMLADSAPRVLLTQSDVQPLLGPIPASIAVLQIDAQAGPWDDMPVGNPSLNGLAGSHLAYIMYTSGSTGQPKGVAMPRAALLNLIHWHLGEGPFLHAAERTMQFAALSFDVAFQEVFTTLCSGASLVLIESSARQDLRQLIHLIREHHVQRLFLPVVALQAIAEAALDCGEPLPTLKTVITAGEQLRISPALRRLFAGSSRQLHNHYGPTETHVVTAHTLDSDASGWPALPPIGRPIANARIYVLDAHGAPLPVGVAGEIHIGGAGVARGYRHRPELSAERFVADPFAAEVGQLHARMYRTGDLGRWRHDGTIEFLGRNDQQIKIRGFRIEPGEIEAALLSCPGVREAVALAREDAPGDKRLVAYVTGDHPLQPEALRAHVAQQLPDHMVPAAYVQLDALPLTPNGKLDRRALPAPQDAAFGTHADEPPHGDLECTLAALWSELLGVQRIGRHDDFFALGGHSLHSLQLASRIRVRLGCDVPLAELFAHPTLAGFAQRVAAAGASSLPAIVPVSRIEPLPLSFAQQRLWFLAQLDGGPSAAYLMPGALRLAGALDVAALRAALDRHVARHEAVRTRFAAVDGTPVQLIAAPEVGFALEEVDLSAHARAESQVERLAAEEAISPFDLARGPLIRGRLLRLAEHEHVLLVTMHHIVSDAWSIGVLLQELGALYAAFAQGKPDPLPPLAIQYADYAVWQRRWIAGDVLQRQLDFWRAHLSDAPALLELPTDRPRPAVQDQAGASLDFELDAQLSTSLHALSRRHGVTLFMTLLASWAALLSRLSGQTDVVIGTPVAHRTRAELEPLIGLFVNTQALRIKLSGEPSQGNAGPSQVSLSPARGGLGAARPWGPSVSELLAQVRATALAAQDHQDVPFEQVVEALNPPRSLAHSPVFQVMFAWQNTPQAKLDLPGLRLQMQETASRFAPFDLDVSMHQAGERLAGSVTFARALFDAATIERCLAHWKTLLRAMAADDAAPVARLPLLSTHERDQLLQGFNAAETAFPQRGIHEFFEDQARRRPDAEALIFEGITLSYADLNARANRLARHLVALGVPPDSCVAIALPRGPQMVVAVLATLKAGGAYLPLDPAYPVERLAFMLADGAPRVLITEARLRAALGVLPPSLAVLNVDAAVRPWDALPASDLTPAALGLAPSHLAYVIYTSGSTGTPKGVMVEHAGLAARIHGLIEQYRFSAHDRVLQFATFTFDASVEEIFCTLCSGATLVLRSDEWIGSAAAFWSRCAEAAVTVVDLPTRFLQQLVESAATAIPDTVRLVIVGGEELPASVSQRWTEAHPTLLNTYGPTEALVVATSQEVQPGGHAGSIGRPVPHARLYLLDAHGEPVPVGVAGEIHIGGAGVARGYLNRPQLTAERFVADPFAGAGARMYRTGDLGRWRPDGRIEFLGRNDDQVKIRGFRVELGEIEARLLQHPGVREAAVLARDDVPGERLLVAYVAGEVSLAPEMLRAHLAAQLPEYMVPAAYVQLDALPMLPNGKLNRRALPAPDDAAFSARTYEPPQGELERTLADLWRELLGRERVGRHDHFFDLGGHSLLAVQMASRIRVRLGCEVPLAELFAQPVLAGFARRVAAAGASALPAIVPVPRSEPLPLSFAQRRLWFLAQLDERASAAYLMPGGVRLIGTLDVTALRFALDRIVARHEALRTSFALTDGTPVQVIAAPDAGFALAQVDLSTHDKPEAELGRLAQEEASTSFDLAHGPLIHGRLLRLAAHDHVLLVTMHHIVSDGWSIAVLLQELSALYAAFAKGAPDPLPPLAIQYADYAVWQRRWISGEVLQRQLDFWRGHLSGAPALLELPGDRPRPAVQDHAGAALGFELDAELSASLKALSRRHGTTLFMTLLASWAALLARLSGQDEVIIGTPVANRTRAEVEPLIGFFVNTLALRVDLSGQPTVAQLLAQVRGTTLAAHAHQDVPFEQVVDALQPVRSLAHAPVFQAMFAWQNTPEGAWALPGLRVEPLMHESRTVKFDLELSMHEAGERIAGHIGYATTLFDPSTVERHLGCWQTMLRAMVTDDTALVPRLPLLSGAERHQVLHGWNATETGLLAGHCIHGLFEEQAARTPDAVALVCAETTLSYAELNARANRLAHDLIALGVTPDARVALALPRGADMVVALLATLKAGGAYVPLDPDYPPERLAFTLADSAPRVLLATAAVRAALGTLPPSLTLLELDAAVRPWDTQPATNPDPTTLGLRPSHLAYVIYTSGSTGAPKGVMVEHAQVVRLFSATQAWFHFGADDVWTLFHSYAFDFSVWELWGALLHGGRLVVVPHLTARSPREFYALLCDHGVTVLNQTPSAFRQLMAAQGESDEPHRLRCVIFGGEALEPATLAPWYARHGERTQLINMYGITETTVHVTYRPLTLDDTRRSASPIGVRIPDLRIYLLDSHGQPVPQGVAGELHVGGAGVARGYLNRPELTAERFVPDTFAAEAGMADARMYKTGDLGRWRPDGTLEFLGRNDHQVKVRGFRIELGEIEARLREHPGVREAVVLAREGSPGDRRLVAYVTSEASLPPEALRAHVATALPEYMVPAAYVRLDALPLTPNRKLDRRALPAPEGSAFSARAYEPPRGKLEHRLAAIWSELLGIERIGRQDDFFALGGHSLLAVMLVAQLHEGLNVELSLRQVFDARQFSQMARLIRLVKAQALLKASSDGSSSAMLIERPQGRAAPSPPAGDKETWGGPAFPSEAQALSEEQNNASA